MAPIKTLIGAKHMFAFQLKMSALPPKADICDATVGVRARGQTRTLTAVLMMGRR